MPSDAYADVDMSELRILGGQRLYGVKGALWLNVGQGDFDRRWKNIGLVIEAMRGRGWLVTLIADVEGQWWCEFTHKDDTDNTIDGVIARQVRDPDPERAALTAAHRALDAEAAVQQDAPAPPAQCQCKHAVHGPDAQVAFDPDIYDCAECGHMIGDHCGPNGECTAPAGDAAGSAPEEAREAQT